MSSAVLPPESVTEVAKAALQWYEQRDRIIGTTWPLETRKQLEEESDVALFRCVHDHLLQVASNQPKEQK